MGHNKYKNHLINVIAATGAYYILIKRKRNFKKSETTNFKTTRKRSESEHCHALVNIVGKIIEFYNVYVIKTIPH